MAVTSETIAAPYEVGRDVFFNPQWRSAVIVPEVPDGAVWLATSDDGWRYFQGWGRIWAVGKR